MRWFVRSSQRPRQVRPRAEILEPRNLLTGGVGNQFADIPATVATKGGSVAIPFSINTQNFTTPHGSLLLGIDISAQSGSSVDPKVASVTDAQGTPVRGLSHGTYDPSLRKQLNGKIQTSAVLVPLDHLPAQPGESAAYRVTVTAQNGTSGTVMAGFYLPGDVNGDGKVDQSDLKAIRAALGSKYGDPKYNLQADANRDGRINSTDLTDARRNLGVKTTISPSVTARVDSASLTDPQHAITDSPTIAIDGTATPGATITIDPSTKQTPEVKVTAGADGAYRALSPLVKGSNSFFLTITDSFGQNNSGVLLPITYQPKP